MHRLERKQFLVRSRRSTVAGETEFTFTHVLTHGVTYAQIPRLARAERHQRAAEWLHGLAGDREDKAELVAHHYARALELFAQAGTDTADLASKARNAFAEAGHQALAVNAYNAALRHLRSVLSLTADGQPPPPGVFLDYAAALYLAGEADEAALAAALDAQLSAKDWNGAAQVAYYLGLWLDHYTGNGKRAAAIMARGRRYASQAGHPPVASHLAGYEAGNLLIAGRTAEAVAFTRECARRAEEAGDIQGHAVLLSWHGIALVESGDQGGIAEMQQAAAVLAEHESAQASLVYHNLGESLVALGDLHAAATARREAGRWAERFDTATGIRTARVTLADAAYHAGDWDRALQLTEPFAGDANQHIASWTLWIRGRILLARGGAPAAIESDAAKIIAYAETSGNNESLVEGLALAALARAAHGNQAGAGSACADLFARWQQAGGLPAETPSIAEIATLPGQELAVRHAQRLLPATSRWKQPLIAISEHRYASAAAAYGQIGSAPLQAAADLRAAWHALTRGEVAAAESRAQSALAFCEQTGAALWARQAAHVLNAITAGQQQRHG